MAFNGVAGIVDVLHGILDAIHKKQLSSKVMLVGKALDIYDAVRAAQKFLDVRDCFVIHVSHISACVHLTARRYLASRSKLDAASTGRIKASNTRACAHLTARRYPAP